MEEFNQQKYIQQYNKQHYKAFKVDLKKKEIDELEKLLNKKGITKAQFLRDAISNLKNKENLKMKRYIIDYEEEIMKNEKESTYEYYENHRDVYETLEEAQAAFDEFEGEIYFNQTNKKWLKKIATLYETEIDDDGEFGDLEQINAK